MFIYDFEVFAHDWMVVFINRDTLEKTVVVNDSNKLKQFYEQNKDEIFAGYNSRGYDQYIFKAILLDINPKEVNDHIIVKKAHGAMFDRRFNDIQLYNYDCQIDKLKSLKQLEGFMGNDIRETSVPFDIDRKLTEQELLDVEKYCCHDVEQTLEVFNTQIEEFDSLVSLVKEFNLDKSYLNKTKAQLSAIILGAENKLKRNDEFEITFPDTLVLSDKYKYILEWYKEPLNLNYKMSLNTNVWGVPHKFAFGGIHGCINNYIQDGYFILSDVASLYPSIMIEYGFLSRNVPKPEIFKQIRDERMELKKARNPMQLPYKIVLNSTYGASKDKYNQLYDPLMANNVCITGQLLILDLIEKLEFEFGDRCELVQSNTDGILVKLQNPSDYERYVAVCNEWSKRTRLDLEHDKYVKVIQKDVNNYIIVDEKGKLESKGSYVKRLNKLDYDLPIINKALVQKLVNDISIEDTINKCDDLKEFQKIVKLSHLYKEVIHNDKSLEEKVHRVFASKLETDSGLFKVKETTLEKIANTPDNCFIYNDDVNELKIPDKLDIQWYIDLANKRLDDFMKDNDIKETIDVYELIQDEYPDFLTLLQDVKDKTDVRPKDIPMLIIMGYFQDYGSCKKLMRIHDLWKLLQNKKSIRKEKLEEYNIDLETALKFGRETPKQVTDMNGYNLLNHLIETLDDSEYDTITLLNLQMEYSKTINYVNPDLDKKLTVVTHIDTKNYVTLYCLNNGKQVTFKVRKALLSEKPIEEGTVLYIGVTKEEPKVTFGGKDKQDKPIWKKHYDIMEWNLYNYTILKEI